MGIVDAKNKVPDLQKFYQAAYKDHTRVWKINPRSRWYMIPYVTLLWGSLGGMFVTCSELHWDDYSHPAASFYGMGRKVLGYNTYFGKE
ncbi:hypothetical protein CSIM01_09348 [Colletotrichum simmondsii]|uniref:Uncharacterized protein n=1 Tax=Colletotrichum simmondsii TaxID=703756 RepID=A0A135TFY3_9PEZI|nr:hypothetical protein CSIM01_09348 [Colletotrichum simmondsii]